MVLRFLTILEMDLQPQGHGCLSCVNCVLVCQMVIVCEMSALITINPVDTGRKLNVHKTLRRRPGHLLNVLFTFNLRPVSTGKRYIHHSMSWLSQ